MSDNNNSANSEPEVAAGISEEDEGHVTVAEVIEGTEVLDDSASEEASAPPGSVSQPAKVMRIGSMTRQLLEEIGSENAKMHMSLVPPSVALITEYNEDYFGVK